MPGSVPVIEFVVTDLQNGGVLEDFGPEHAARMVEDVPINRVVLNKIPDLVGIRHPPETIKLLESFLEVSWHGIKNGDGITGTLTHGG